jgi:hypothetical protein
MMEIDSARSHAIAAALNDRKANYCGHKLNHCVIKCGVTYNLKEERWEVIPTLSRQQFVNDNSVRLRRR